ncbi:hypothetical protein T484DRAFT_1742579 [Baffinella frigidus]|nr:hypothetical protein T484DRAFT_1742579 [Cryptophyta sp. CCMP2293]
MLTRRVRKAQARDDDKKLGEFLRPKRSPGTPRGMDFSHEEESILDVIASMNIPFDSSELLAPPAEAPLQENTWARAPCEEQQSFPCLLANCSLDDKCIDCWLHTHTPAHVSQSWNLSQSLPTRSTFSGTMPPVQYERAESVPTGGSGKRTHTSAFHAVAWEHSNQAAIAAPHYPAAHRLSYDQHPRQCGDAWAFAKSWCEAGDCSHQAPERAPTAPTAPFSEPPSPAGEGGDAFWSRVQLRWKMLAHSKR